MSRQCGAHMEIRIAQPQLGLEEIEAVSKVISSGMIAHGPETRAFEKEFAEFVGVRFACAVNNGTAALSLSLSALGIRPGDEVITTPFTFVATANAILSCGAIPVFADIDEDTFNLSPQSVESIISEKTKAIMPVHLYGHPADMPKFEEVSKKYNLKLIGDAAQAHGASISGKAIGQFGDVECFSFYPTKNMTTAEGGMVITNSKKVADSVRQLRSHGMTKSLKDRYSKGYPWIFDIKEPGYNYRLDEIRSALGISQLKRIKKINELRKNASLYYHKNLQNIPGIILPDMVKDKSHSYHLYTIRVTKPFKLSRNQLYKKLKDNGIRTTVYWMPIHEYAAYSKFAKKSNVVNTAKIYDEILALPLFPNISKKHQDTVIKVLKSF